MKQTNPDIPDFDFSRLIVVQSLLRPLGEIVES